MGRSLEGKKERPLAAQVREFEITCTDLAVGGRGLGRVADGRVALVEGALATERARAELVKEHRSYLEARALEILEPSPDRVAPACPSYGDCGGCELMHLAHHAQVARQGRLG